MKKISITLAVLASGLGSAFAADLPSTKAPAYLPPPPPPPLWTGFYVGLNAGYTFANNNRTTLSTAPFAWDAGFPHGGFDPNHLNAFAFAASGVGTGNNDGFIGGGQIGYNWQFGPSFVAGIEADIQGIAGTGGASAFSSAAFVPSDPSNYVGFHTVTKGLDYLGTVRGRLGWLFTPTLLVFGTGGLAYGGVTVNTSSTIVNDVYQPAHLPNVFAGSAFADTRVGWTAGGGVEWMFWPNWSAKVEYLYYDLGTVSTQFVARQPDLASGLNADFVGTARTRFDGHIVRAGLNYHFNWGAAPVVAKY